MIFCQPRATNQQNVKPQQSTKHQIQKKRIILKQSWFTITTRFQKKILNDISRDNRNRIPNCTFSKKARLRVQSGLLSVTIPSLIRANGNTSWSLLLSIVQCTSHFDAFQHWRVFDNSSSSLPFLRSSVPPPRAGPLTKGLTW